MTINGEDYKEVYFYDFYVKPGISKNSSYGIFKAVVARGQNGGEHFLSFSKPKNMDAVEEIRAISGLDLSGPR